MDENHLDENGDLDESFPPLDDICTTIPEEASEELREEEEEAAAAAAALGAIRETTPVISGDFGKTQKQNQ